MYNSVCNVLVVVGSLKEEVRSVPRTDGLFISPGEGQDDDDSDHAPDDEEEGLEHSRKIIHFNYLFRNRALGHLIGLKHIHLVIS